MFHNNPRKQQQNLAIRVQQENLLNWPGKKSGTREHFFVTELF